MRGAHTGRGRVTTLTVAMDTTPCTSAEEEWGGRKGKRKRVGKRRRGQGKRYKYMHSMLCTFHVFQLVTAGRFLLKNP